jgi:hypothetical protein
MMDVNHFKVLQAYIFVHVIVHIIVVKLVGVILVIVVNILF